MRAAATPAREAAGYVLGLCRAFVAGSPPPPLDGVDAAAAAALVRAHRLLPTVGPLLVEVLDPASAAATALRGSLADLKRRHGLVWLELRRLTAALDEERVPHVVLKGLALGPTVYPGPERRFVSDMDVLVAPESLESALAALERIGFKLADTRREPSFYRWHHFHLILTGPLRVPLELHWDLSRPRDYVRFDVRGFIDRSPTVEADGTQLRIPSDADQLLHAAAQTLRDGFADLRRIVDAALLVRRGAAGGAELPALAREQGMATPLWLLLETQRCLLGVEGGEVCARALRPRPVVRACLQSLEIPRRAVAREAEQWIGLKRWLLWLCAPSPASGLRLIGRFLRPGTAELLDAGHLHQLPQGAADGLRRWSWPHALSLCKLAGWQAGCLLRRAGGWRS